jgi:hypothetical protein
MDSSSLEKISEKLDYYLEHPEEEAPFPFTHRVELERSLAQRAQNPEESSETSSLSSWSLEDINEPRKDNILLIDGKCLLTARSFHKLLACVIEDAIVKLYFDHTTVEIPFSTSEEAQQLLRKIHEHVINT